MPDMKSAAVLTIRNAPDLDRHSLRSAATWVMSQADALVDGGPSWASKNPSWVTMGRRRWELSSNDGNGGVVAAIILTVRGVSHMTEKGRADIAAWLRKQAGWLVEAGSDYHTTFRARYLYED